VRLATFNLLHGRAPADGRVDLDRLAEAVRTLDADVLALQEVDRGQPRSGGADLAQVAARAGGAVAARFLPALTGLPGAWSPAAPGDGDGRPQYGVALVTRLPVLAWREVRLPRLPGRVPVLFRGKRRPELVTDEPRVALLARLQTPRGPLTVASTHLSFIPGWNVVQLRALLLAAAGSGPLVIAGDLNLQPGPARRVSGLRPLAAGLTFPSHAPERQLDHLLARGVDGPVRGSAPCLPLSDHCALVADVADD
jgi:endonuclease/exonuclease/phosphatase family metal-dependent hydrolase